MHTRRRKTIRILHVEDNQVVADMVRETLEVEGWEVEVCSDGTTALEKIAGDNHYDLLLLDFEVPGTNGQELVQRARELTGDAQTPIVVLSAAPVGVAVCRAGANAFLHKPQDMNSVVATIKHWLNCQRDVRQDDL